MSKTNDRVNVGLGIILLNKKGEILIGKRKGFVPKYSIPGGHLELGETFEVGAIREIKEETGLEVKNPKVIAITNNLETYRETGTHHVSVVLLVENVLGEPENKEPEKCEAWLWSNPRSLPEPHFDASRTAIKSFLEKKFYAQ